MAQRSRPQADHIANYPFPSDPGPYTCDQWAQYMQLVHTGDRETEQGPLIDVWSSLACSTAGADTVYVYAGAGFVNGHLLIVGDTETFTIAAPTVAGRTDCVVMCENNTNAPIIATDAGRPFLFPDDLTEYETAPVSAIPAYSARLVIIEGVEGGGVPALDTTNAKFMVELYRYDISTAPAFSNQIDRRQWAMTPMASVQKIAEHIVLTAASNTITFDNIPQCFRHLRIVGHGKSSFVGAASEMISVRFNNDAGSNYGLIWLQNVNAGDSSLGIPIGGATRLDVGHITASAGAAYPNVGDGFTLEIPNYRNTVLIKSAIFHGMRADTGLLATVSSFYTCGWWDNTAAITRVDLLLLAAGNWDVGTAVTLYGET